MKTGKSTKQQAERIPLHNFAAGMLADMLEDYGLTQKALANAIGVPPQRINDILGERRLITPDMALRLGRYFGNRPDYWLDVQNAWLLRRAREKSSARLQEIVPLAAAN